eukprot:317836-Rhodomonas_salina.1
MFCPYDAYPDNAATKSSSSVEVEDHSMGDSLGAPVTMVALYEPGSSKSACHSSQLHPRERKAHILRRVAQLPDLGGGRFCTLCRRKSPTRAWSR